MSHRHALLAVLALVPALGFAQPEMPRVDQRQENQLRRLEQGVASGSLTAHEAHRLERGQQHVANVEAQVKSDGVVTRQERGRLHHAEGVQSRRLYVQKHDRQHDYDHNGRVDRPARR